MTCNYPKKTQTPEDIFTPRTLAQTTAWLLSWQQGPGSFGGLHLHACWGESSAIARKYHGHSVVFLASLLRGVMRLAERQNGERWRDLAANIVQTLLWERKTEGGFAHASGEYEPTYGPQSSCPIHQMMPAWALIDYAAWSLAQPLLAKNIQQALQSHFQWFQNFWWKRGNDWQRPLPHEGWCGVTNQDLVVVAAYARYGKIFGDWNWFEKYGKPAMSIYLGKNYFRPNTGQFFRGDRKDFLERVSYLGIIDQCLQSIYQDTGVESISPVLMSIRENLFRSVQHDQRRGWLIAWGAEYSETDDLADLRWNTSKVQISAYPEILPILNAHALCTQNLTYQSKVAKLEEVLASWIYSDGSLPAALDLDAPILCLPGSWAQLAWWHYLLQCCTESIDFDQLPPVPTVLRNAGDLSFLHSRDWWQLRQGKESIWWGYKPDAHGVFRSSDTPANLSPPSHCTIDFEENIFLPIPSPLPTSQEQ